MILQEINGRGFTLIEMIAVIVLLAILGVVAMSRLGGFGGFESKAFFDDTVNAIRYAQKLAISTGCNVQVQLTANSYNVHQGTTCTSGIYTLDVTNPANRSNPYVNRNPDVTINPPAVFIFTPQSTVTGLAGDTVFTLDGRSFTVYQHTGLTDVQ